MLSSLARLALLFLLLRGKKKKKERIANDGELLLLKCCLICNRSSFPQPAIPALRISALHRQRAYAFLM